MSLATEVATRVQELVASETVIDLTNQRDAGVATDAAVLAACSGMASRTVKRLLGRSAEDDTGDEHEDAIDFGARLVLLQMATEYSLTLTDAGAAYVSGVHKELKMEAEARKQAQTGMTDTDAYEDFAASDARYNVEIWHEQD